jgi:hypothetical protein
MKVTVNRIETETDCNHAREVLRATYLDEKQWIEHEDKMFDPTDLQNDKISWFLCCHGDKPVGVVRVLYEPPIELYREYGFKQIGTAFDVESFVKNKRIAEIGRFAVLKEYRHHIIFAASLMRAATQETVSRGYSHFVTDVFEGEQHSPYEFHTRVMGFVPVATHEVGELNCPNRRITLILDLRQAYRRLKNSKKRVYRMMTEGWPKELHHRMAS